MKNWRNHLGHYVVVEWWDAYGKTWHEKHDPKDDPPYVNETNGFLEEGPDGYLTLIHERGWQGPDQEDVQYSSVPLGCVKEIRRTR